MGPKMHGLTDKNSANKIRRPFKNWTPVLHLAKIKEISIP